jgi:hypothetical protein
MNIIVHGIDETLKNPLTMEEVAEITKGCFLLIRVLGPEASYIWCSRENFKIIKTKLKGVDIILKGEHNDNGYKFISFMVWLNHVAIKKKMRKEKKRSCRRV